MKIMFSETSGRGKEKEKSGAKAEEEKNPHQDCNWAGDVKIPLVISLAYQKARTTGKAKNYNSDYGTFTSGVELWETR